MARNTRSKRVSAKVDEFNDSASSNDLGDEIVEFDESVAEAEAENLVQVQDVTEDVSVTVIDEAIFSACDRLEQQMGGFTEIATAMSEPTERTAHGLENIVGFGVGEKMEGGRYTGDLALKVYVVEKSSLSKVEESAVAPFDVDGFPTDVEEVGEIYADSFRGRQRPAPGGSSIGHPDITAGTHGCLVVLNNNRLCCLSNNHVTANSNAASIGDSIIQPGPADGGRLPRDRIGVLQAFVPIDFSGGANAVDAAVTWTSFRLLSGQHHCYQINTQPVRPSLNMTVRKCGRTTQHTLGIVSGLRVSVRVDYRSAGVALFRNQIQIRGVGGDFSRGGDSGSLVVTAGSRQPVGLLFAGGGGVTFANPIDSVISALGVRRFLNAP